METTVFPIFMSLRPWTIPIVNTDPSSSDEGLGTATRLWSPQLSRKNVSFRTVTAKDYLGTHKV